MLQRIAAYGMIIIFLLSIVLHVLVITGIIPYTVVWGGRLASLSEMYVFEAASIALNAVFLCVVLVKSHMLQLRAPTRLVTITLWVMVALFILNTIGNVLSTNRFEQLVFTPITLLLSVFALILLLRKPTANSD